MTDRTQRQSNTRDLFLTVKEVARAAGVEAHVVRPYERAGLLRRARELANSFVVAISTRHPVRWSGTPLCNGFGNIPHRRRLARRSTWHKVHLRRRA